MKIDDPRPYAHMIENAEDTEMEFDAYGDFISNLCLIVWGYMSELDESDVEMTEKEARKTLEKHELYENV